MNTDIPLRKRLFKLVQWGGQEDGADLLGRPVGYENAYISSYAVIDVGRKLPRDLALGESTVATYWLSGSKGQYKIVRVE